MIFWIGIAVGAFLAWCATQSHFVKSWVLLFNLVIAVYIAVFTAPLVTHDLVEAQQTAYGHALALLAIVGGALFALCNICFMLMPDDKDVDLPEALNTILCGAVGFLGGMLVWSFLVVLIYVSPLGETNFARQCGLTRDRRPTSVSFLCACCDVVHLVASNGSVRSSGDVIDKMAGLKGQLVPPPEPQPAPLPALPRGLLKLPESGS